MTLGKEDKTMNQEKLFKMDCEADEQSRLSTDSPHIKLLSWTPNPLKLMWMVYNFGNTNKSIDELEAIPVTRVELETTYKLLMRDFTSIP